MICPECNGRGESIYYVETDRDENTVTVEQRKGICRTCNGSGAKQQTNADRIRAMSDEELAKDWMRDLCVCNRCAYTNECECDDYVTAEKCKEGILEWLKQPAEE